MQKLPCFLTGVPQSYINIAAGNAEIAVLFGWCPTKLYTYISIASLVLTLWGGGAPTTGGVRDWVLRGAVLRHREVLFDIPQGTISFVDAECERATPANAVLRGAFAFAPCSSSSGGGGNETLEPAPAVALHDEMSPRDEQALPVPSWWRWVKAALPSSWI